MRNGFCFLVDTLPSFIRINDRSLTIDTRTSTALSVILYLKGEHSDYEKAEYTATRLLTDYKRHTIREIVQEVGTTEIELANALLRYLSGYPEVKSWWELHREAEKKAPARYSPTKAIQPNFDYVQDSDAIISAFWQTYKITLREVRNLHWWEFLALFNNLPDNTTFSRIRQIRSMKPNPKDSPERKAEIREAQRTVAIIETRSPEQRRADLQAQFNELEL